MLRTVNHFLGDLWEVRESGELVALVKTRAEAHLCALGPEMKELLKRIAEVDEYTPLHPGTLKLIDDMLDTLNE